MNINLWNKYCLGLWMAAKYQWACRWQLFGKGILYVVTVCVFSQVFTSVKEDGQRIWYVALTQLISLSAIPSSFQMEQDLTSSFQYQYFLFRPVGYVRFRWSEAIGASLVNYFLLWPCFVVATTLNAKTHPQLTSMLWGSLYGMLSITLRIVICSLIGLLAWWIKDIRNIFYVNLTASFCFGGLIVPLDFYPPVLQKISFLTPYPWMLWAPAQLINDRIGLTTALSWICLWLLVTATALSLLTKKWLQQLVVKGH